MLASQSAPLRPLARPLLLLCLLLLPLSLGAQEPASELASEAPSGTPSATPPTTPPEGTKGTELSRRHERWLAEVDVLISPAERDAFRALTQDYQRDAFIREFWRVRDPHPETARNELRESWDEHLEAARLRFEDLGEVRARMLLVNGEPTASLQVPCAGLLRPLEIWFYSGTARIRDSFSLVFYSPQGGLVGPYRLWYPSQGLEILLSFRTDLLGRAEAIFEAIGRECPRSQEILSGLSNAIDWGRVEEEIDVVPRPGEEWLRTFVAYSTDLPAGAETFDADLTLSFPGQRQSRIALQGVVGVPLEAVNGLPETPETAAANAPRSFILDGELLRKGELFEHFRYRFTLRPNDLVGGRFPLVFQRYLRPGEYTLVVKLEDLASGAFFREQRLVEVPATPLAAPPTFAEMAAPMAPAPGSGTARGGTAFDRLAEANFTLAAAEVGIRLLALPPRLLVGKQRFEAVTVGEEIARVRFELDGRRVLAKTRPPFSAELDLGTAPRTHRLRVIAEDGDGGELAADELLINAGPHRFAARLIEPRPGEFYVESVRATAVVEVPEGEILDRLEFFLNDDLVATLYQPPYTQPILLPEAERTTWVRTVAHLEGGATAEDVVFVNSPDPSGELDVRFVELYTTVLDRKGRPVEGLTQADFTVLEDGVEQEVRRFELVREQPIYAGILLDTSSSMVEEIEDAVAGALAFFETVLTPRDRAAVITFNQSPSLAVRFTGDPQILADGVRGLVAEGETALYDSLIYGLYYFSGIRGKRALILLSDGEDAGSRYNYEDVIEYARRTGVAIYTVGLDLGTRQAEIRLKLSRLARETGGLAFFIEGTGGLARVYQTIEAELRAQYLLAYQSSSEGDDEGFRQVEVRMAEPGLEAKTISGYYP